MSVLPRPQIAALAAVVLSINTSPLLAQNELVLEEIIVTSQKREQSLQDVPISVAAFGYEKLQAMGIDELEDIGANVPNLVINNFNNDASTVRLFIRGIGQNDVQLTQDPSVALYIDGVYVGTSIGSGMESIDLERIEVLRGPQGTLYGRNSTGGAVNMISRRPELNKFGFKQSLTTGNFDLFKSKTSINVPLGGKAAARLAYLISDRDALTENLGEGEDWAIEDRTAWRLDLRAELTNELMLDYTYDQSDIDDTSRLEFLHDAINPFGLASFCTEPFPDRRPDEATACRPVEPSAVEINGHNLTLAWDASDEITVKSITAYREVESDVSHDGTPTVGIIANNPASSSVRRTDFEQFTQEFQVIGTAFDDQLEYVTGLYYYADEATQQADSISVLGPRSPNDFTTSENTSLAVYGQYTYTPKAADRWHFTLGMRYSDDDREATRINENSATFAAEGGFTAENCADPYLQLVGCQPDGVIATATYDKSFQNFNPSFTVSYDVTDSANLYAKVATGYKSGGTSQRSANPTAFSQGFDEEDVTSYELGFKGRLFNERVSVNSALFKMDIDGFQASVQTGGTAGDRDFTPVDGTEIEGWEIDIVALLSDGLTFSLGYGWLDTQMGVDQIVTLLDTGVEQITLVVPEVSYAPGNSLTAALDYQRDLGFAQLDAHLGYAYQDSAATSLNVADDLPTDERGLIDASLRLSQLKLGEGELSVSLWGKNLTDQEYIIINTGSLGALFPGGALGFPTWTTWGDPRTYGVTIEFEY